MILFVLNCRLFIINIKVRDVFIRRFFYFVLVHIVVHRVPITLGYITAINTTLKFVNIWTELGCVSVPMPRRLPQWLQDIHSEEVICYQPNTLFQSAFIKCLRENIPLKPLQHIRTRLPKFDVELYYTDNKFCYPPLCTESNYHTHCHSSHFNYLYSFPRDYDFVNLCERVSTCKRSELSTYGKDVRRASVKRRLFE